MTKATGGVTQIWPSSLEAVEEGVCWAARDSSLHRLAPSHALRVSPEITPQRLGLRLHVDTRCVSICCPTNLTPRLSGTFMNGSCNFQVPISNGSLSYGKPAKSSHPKATLSRGSLALSRPRRCKAHLLQQYISIRLKAVVDPARTVCTEAKQ